MESANTPYITHLDVLWRNLPLPLPRPPCGWVQLSWQHIISLSSNPLHVAKDGSGGVGIRPNGLRLLKGCDNKHGRQAVTMSCEVGLNLWNTVSCVGINTYVQTHIHGKTMGKDTCVGVSRCGGGGGGEGVIVSLVCWPLPSHCYYCTIVATRRWGRCGIVQ